MKYPEDFKEFTGKRLNPQEMNTLLSEALSEQETAVLDDTMVEPHEGNIYIWKLEAIGEIPS